MSFYIDDEIVFESYSIWSDNDKPHTYCMSVNIDVKTKEMVEKLDLLFHTLKIKTVHKLKTTFSWKYKTTTDTYLCLATLKFKDIYKLIDVRDNSFSPWNRFVGVVDAKGGFDKIRLANTYIELDTCLPMVPMRQTSGLKETPDGYITIDMTPPENKPDTPSYASTLAALDIIRKYIEGTYKK